MLLRLVKVVRDKVGNNLAEHEVSYGPIVDDEVFIANLRRKLVEEAVEYLQDPCEEELADVFEVADALRKHDLKISLPDLAVVGAQKKEKKGGFDKGIGMYVKVVEE